MYIKRIYPILGMMKWTRWETMLFFVIALIPTILFEVFELTWLQIPWTPIALVGTALAFVIGFQNNAAYGRIWEARKIWGGIVNTSRTWGMKIKAMVTNEHSDNPVSEDLLKKEIKTLTYRHIAWMTALRYAMRQKKPWEVFMDHKSNREYKGQMHIPENENTLEAELKPYLNEKEREYVLSKGNKQTAILNLQSDHLKGLKEKGLVWEFSFLELENVLEELFTLQGKSERIKNFPYPRQYATIGHYFVWMFILLLPFGVIPEFDDIGKILQSDFPLVSQYFVWAAIPFSVIVSWIFHTMERIGRAGENPFEGTANDVPISTISRGIEIDLRQMLDENDDEIPKQYPIMWDAQM
jgi:putative membrane protein